MSEIQRLLEQYTATGEIAGAALRVRKNGETAAEVCCGMADLAQRRPVQPDTVFRLASMTKPLIAVLTLILEEKGLLRLDDRLERYLPADPRVTLRQLLQHCSGLGQGRAGVEASLAAMCPGDTLAQRARRFAALAPDFEPGAGTGYSMMSGFDILGYVLELCAGLPLEEVLHRYLLDPLDIADMGYTLSAGARSRLARLYRKDPAGLTDVTDTEPVWQLVDPLKDGYFSGAGGVLGTLEGYDRFVQLLANEGELDGVRLLRCETVRRIPAETAAHGLELRPGCRWGLGMVRFDEPVKTGRGLSAGSYGWSGAYGTHFYIDPAQRLQVVLMINRSDIGGASSPVSLALEHAVYSEFIR